jgi:alkylhydroperoxidase family enzyme
MPSRKFITSEVIVDQHCEAMVACAANKTATHQLKETTMVSYAVQTIDSAPAESKPAMEQLQHVFGFVPNIVGALSNSPVLLKSLVGLFQRVHGGNFSEPEIQILLLTNAVTNSCPWAVAFHTTLALQQGIDRADVQAIRERRLPANSRYSALSRLARTLIERRGHLITEDLATFIEAGFTAELALEVIAVSAASTITNYGGTITNPPLEAVFQEHAWSV